MRKTSILDIQVVPGHPNNAWIECYRNSTEHAAQHGFAEHKAEEERARTEHARQEKIEKLEQFQLQVNSRVQYLHRYKHREKSKQRLKLEEENRKALEQRSVGMTIPYRGTSKHLHKLNAELVRQCGGSNNNNKSAVLETQHVQAFQRLTQKVGSETLTGKQRLFAKKVAGAQVEILPGGTWGTLNNQKQQAQNDFPENNSTREINRQKEPLINSHNEPLADAWGQIPNFQRGEFASHKRATNQSMTDMTTNNRMINQSIADMSTKNRSLNQSMADMRTNNKTINQSLADMSTNNRSLNQSTVSMSTTHHAQDFQTFNDMQQANIDNSVYNEGAEMRGVETGNCIDQQGELNELDKEKENQCLTRESMIYSGVCPVNELHKRLVERQIDIKQIEQVQKQEQYWQQRKMFMNMEREEVRSRVQLNKHKERVARLKLEKERERRKLENRNSNVQINVQEHAVLDMNLSNEEDEKEKQKVETQKRKKDKETELKRYMEALIAVVKERVRLSALRLPMLCQCAVNSVWDSHPDKCANNCVFYHNPRAFVKALSGVLKNSGTEPVS